MLLFHFTNKTDRTSPLNNIITTHTGGVSHFHTEEQERRFFHAPLLRSRGRKSLVLCGFAGAFLARQGIYTFSLKTAFLLRNKPTAKE